MKTSVNLIRQANNKRDPIAWSRLAEIYEPLIADWLRQAGVKKHDIENVCLKVFLEVHRRLGSFEHPGREGAFRHWLRDITVNQCRRYRSRNAKHFDVSSGSKVDRFLDRLADPQTDLAKRWNLDHDKHILQAILEKLSREFDYNSMYAFHELIICRSPAIKVVEALGISAREALALSSQVMTRVLQEVAFLNDDPDFDFRLK